MPAYIIVVFAIMVFVGLSIADYMWSKCFKRTYRPQISSAIIALSIMLTLL